jgi:hypothetical protein
MKQTFDSPRVIELFVKVGLIAALAAVLLAPMTIRATGNELGSRVEHTWPMLKRTSWNALPLPPIPHLATMPWLHWYGLDQKRDATWMKIDTLLAPKFELMGPAVAHTSCDETSVIAGAPSARHDIASATSRMNCHA